MQMEWKLITHIPLNQHISMLSHSICSQLELLTRYLNLNSIFELSFLFRLESSVQAPKKSMVKQNQSKLILEILKSFESHDPLQLLDSRTSNNNGLSIAELKSGTCLKLTLSLWEFLPPAQGFKFSKSASSKAIISYVNKLK